MTTTFETQTHLSTAKTAITLLAKKKVKDWMSRNPITVLPTTYIGTAYKLMSERHIRRLPVVEDGALIGIVTLGDLRSLGADTASDEAMKIRVDAAFRANPITTTEAALLVDAARTMLHHKISGLPVLSSSDQSLVGIITESDIFRAFIADETK
jgi:CBS domain-containing protein